MTQATGTVKIILDNVNITTDYVRNMPIVLNRMGNGSADVEIELVGTNTLIVGNNIVSGSAAAPSSSRAAAAA